MTTVTVIDNPISVTVTNNAIAVNFSYAGPQGPGGAGYIWSEKTGAFGMSGGNAYIANNSSQVVATLPTTANSGDQMRIVGKGAGGWKVAQNSGQTIHFGNLNTTTGTGGSIASQSTNDALEIVCTTANTDFTILTSQGNLTVV